MLERTGPTQLVDLFRNLNVSHGVVGERNSWYNSNQPSTLTENVANVNLPGLGASRTLVLINGRRHVPVPARLIGGRFVDVNTIPAIAVGRLEVLKEGASATYGSDAVGGAETTRRSPVSGAAGSGSPPPSCPRSGSTGKSCRWRIAPGRSTA